MSYDISDEDYSKAQKYFDAEKRFDVAWWILIALMLIGLGFIFYLDRTYIAEAQGVEGENISVEGKPLYTSNTYKVVEYFTESEDIIDFYETAFRDQVDRTLDWIDRYRDLKERCGI